MKLREKSSTLLPLAALSALLVSGCATFGLVYEDVGHPPIEVVVKGDRAGLAWDPNLNASLTGRQLLKKGVACSQDVLKLVAWGDGTQAAAAKQGGVTEVVGVDFENTAILAFIYTQNCTVVYGSDGSGSPAPAASVTEMPETVLAAPPPAPAEGAPEAPPAPETSAAPATSASPAPAAPSAPSP